MMSNEIIIRRCPVCCQLYDTEIDNCYVIQPEKCSRCKSSLPLLINGKEPVYQECVKYRITKG